MRVFSLLLVLAVSTTVSSAYDLSLEKRLHPGIFNNPQAGSITVPTDRHVIAATEIPDATTGRTYCWWHNPDAGGSGSVNVLFSRGTSTENADRRPMVFETSTSTLLYFRDRDQSGSSYNNGFSITTTPNVWQHVCWVHSSSAILAYLDGAFVDSEVSTGPKNNALPLTFGGTGTYSTASTASMFDLRLINSALTANDVKELYLLTKGDVPLVTSLQTFLEPALAATPQPALAGVWEPSDSLTWTDATISPTNARTYMFWLKVAANHATQYTWVFGKGDYDTRAPALFIKPGTSGARQLHFRSHWYNGANELQMNGNVESGITLPANDWVHVAFVMADGDWRQYEGGVLVGSSTSLGRPFVTTKDVVSSISPTTADADVQVHKLRYFESALAEGAILADAARGACFYLEYTSSDLLSSQNSVNLDSVSFSSTVWFKAPESSSAPYDFAFHGNQQSANANFAMAVRPSGAFTCAHWTNDLDSPSVYSATDLQAFHFYACTYNATTGVRKLFVDGVKLAEDNAGVNSYVAGAQPFVANQYRPNAGIIDNWGIWDRELSETEVADQFTGTYDPEGLLAFYNFDTIHTGPTRTPDSSGNNNHMVASSGSLSISRLPNPFQAEQCVSVNPVDSTAPVISPVSIASNNTDTTQAETGDLVTLSFTANEDTATPSVTIFGRTATVSGGPQVWTATVVVAQGDATGVVPFSINVTDLADNSITDVDATTDSSSVTRVCSEYELGPTCSCSSAVQGTVTEGIMDMLLYTETGTPPSYSRFEDDRLYIVYDESVWYSTVTRSFNNTDGLCSQHWTWSSTEDFDACTRTWEGWADWSNVVADCEFERSTDANDISYTTNFAVTVSETVPALRGGPVTRTVKHVLPFTLAIPTRVTANASDIVAFSPVVEIGAIVAQTLKGTPGTDISMDVSFLTSVQWPFVLKSATWGTITADDNGAPDAFTLETTAGSCDDNNATEPNCQNTWSSTVHPASQATTCELDGQYTVNWVVDCHDSVKASNDCPIDTATDDATLTFTIDTSSFCVQVADTVTLSAAIYTYEDAAHTILKDDFLDGQTVYAEVPTSSDKVSIDSTRVVDATIVRVTEADISLIAAGDIVLPNDYAVARADGGSSAAGVSSKPSFQFTVNTASTHMDLADDSSETMTLAATVAVRYQNAGQAAFSKVRFETALQTKEKDVAASTSVGFGGTQSTTTGTSSAASSEATIMGVNAMVVYGAGAIMALVLITAYVVLRRSDPTPTVNKSESQVQLTTADAGETSQV